MGRQFDFGRNQILRPEFLNVLQKVLQSYLDNFFLEASGAEVLAPATLDDPISFNVDRRMRRASTTLAVTVTGAAGIRDVYVVVRPEQPNPLELLAMPDGVEPTLVGREVARHVGEVTFDGSVVTSVTTYPVRTGADMLAGRSSTYTPHRFGIPVANEDGRLHPGWFPDIATKQEMLGTIKRFWIPPGGTLTLEEGLRLLDGTVVLAADHDWSVGDITLPNMLNKVTRGASLAEAYSEVALALDNALGAPGMNGVSGSNALRNLAHTHPVGNHYHDPIGHRHKIKPHTHDIPAHRHVDNNFDGSRTFRYTDGLTSITFRGAETQNAPAHTGGVVASEAAIRSGYDPVDPGTGTRYTTSDGSGTSGSALGTTDTRPKLYGLVYALKVKNPT